MTGVTGEFKGASATKQLLITLLVSLGLLSLFISTFTLLNPQNGSSVNLRPEKSDLALVFVSDGFSNREDFLDYGTMLVNGSDPSLATVDPFKQLKENISVYSVFKRGSICDIDEDCDYKELEARVRKESRLKLPQHLRLIVISQKQFRSYALYTRRDNSALFLSLRNRYQSKRDHTVKREFLHELGHLFGLKEERGRGNFSLDSKERDQIQNAAHLPGRPNCARNLSQAKRWWGHLAERYNDVGYYHGCSGNKNWIKPHKNSLMYSPYQSTNNYGRANEAYLHKLLLCAYLQPGDKLCDNFVVS